MHDFLIDTDILSIFAKADGLSIPDSPTKRPFLAVGKKSRDPDARTLNRDPGRRERLGRNGRAYVGARYTSQVVAHRYASLLERIVG